MRTKLVATAVLLAFALVMSLSIGQLTTRVAIRFVQAAHIPDDPPPLADGAGDIDAGPDECPWADERAP